MKLYHTFLYCSQNKTKENTRRKTKINSLRTGFEPVRVTPSDFESDALTTRPSQHIITRLFKYILNPLFILEPYGQNMKISSDM